MALESVDQQWSTPLNSQRLYFPRICNIIIDMYICRVCNQHFEDTFSHVLVSDPNGYNPIDEPHGKLYHELAQGIEPKVGRCFCGGTVTTIGAGAAGWETACETCSMLYAED